MASQKGEVSAVHAMKHLVKCGLKKTLFSFLYNKYTFTIILNNPILPREMKAYAH